MKNRFSRLFCALLAFSMILSACGITVFAEETATASEEPVYYVQHGAKGDGTTLETPGDFKTVVNAINTKYGAGDTVIIKIVRTESDNKESVPTDQLSTLSHAALGDIPAHTAMLVLTSADLQNKSRLVWQNVYSTAANTGSSITLTGPLTIENLKVIDVRYNHYWDLYAEANHFVIGEGTGWYRPYVTNGMYKLEGRNYTGSINGGSRGGKDFSKPAVMEFADNSFNNFSQITFSGYHESYKMTFKEDATLKFGKGTAAKVTLSNIRDTYAIYKKNANLVLNGTTITEFNNRTTNLPIVKGAIQIIKNNGAKITKNTVSAYSDDARTTLSPVYDITVETGAVLDVTATAGVYTVDSDNTAYVLSDDGMTVWYSVNGKLSLPNAGTYTVKNTADLASAVKAPTLSVIYQFDGWEDDGKGTMTAKYSKINDEELSKYYVKYGGTGDGRTYDAPAGTIANVIKSVNADGFKKGDEVTVYLVPTGNEPTTEQLNYKSTTQGNPPVKLGVENGFISWQYPNVLHEATITFTTYNYGAEGVEKMILANGDKVTEANSAGSNLWRGGLAHMYLCGPTVFKDLFIIDLRTDASNDFYTQGHSFKLENCEWRQTALSKSPLGGYTWEDWKNHFYLGNHGTSTYSQNANSNGTTIIDNPSLIYDLFLICRGEKNGTSYAYFGNDEKASTLPIMYATNNAKSIQHGVASYVFNNTTINDFKNNKDASMPAPTVDAMQIVLNNGSSIGTNTASINGYVYILNVAKGGKLDVTENVGVYTVETDKKYAFAYAGGDKIYYAAAGATLTVDAPGTYDIGFVDSVDEVTVDYVSEVEGYVFDKWEDDGNGTFFAALKPDTEGKAAYFVKTGMTGDGRTAENAAANVFEAVKSINADVASGKLTAGQDVYLYVADGDDWQTFNADVLVGKNAGVKPHHMAIWGPNGGQPAAYSVVLNVRSYNPFDPAHLCSNENLGKNESLDTNGVTTFDDIILVDTRFGYREFELHGNNTTFGANTKFWHLDVGSAEADAKWGGKFGKDAFNVTVGAYNAKTYEKDVTVRFDNSIYATGGDRGIFLGGSVSNKSVFNGNVTVYFNNPELVSSLQWQGSSTTGTNTFNKNLNLVFEDAKEIYYRTRNGAAVTAENLQMITKSTVKFFNNSGAACKVTDIPANVTVNGGTWVLKLDEGVENFLDVTATAGTFKVYEGFIAVATNEKTNGVVISNAGTLKLEAGVYTVNYMDAGDLESTAVVVTFDGESDGNVYVADTPFELPARPDGVIKQFAGWKLEGSDTIYKAGELYTPKTAGELLAFTSVWQNYADTVAVYVDAVNGSDDNDGATALTAFKTLAKAFAFVDTKTESVKKVAIVGEYDQSGALPAANNAIVITGDGSGDSVLDMNYDCIFLQSDVKFENIKLTTTTTEGGKVLYSNTFDLEFGKNVTTDTKYNIRVGTNVMDNFAKPLYAKFESGKFASLEIGNFWISGKRATAGKTDVIIDGASISTILFTSNGWLDTHLGNDFTGPVRLTVNSGSVGKITYTTEADNSAKYARFLDSVEILSNNGATVTMASNFTAPNGAWMVNAQKAEDGSYLEMTSVKGKYNVIGGMTALAKDKDGKQYVSMDGVLTLPEGYYTVEFVDKIEYLQEGDKINFYATCTVDLTLIKVPQYEGKVFMGWVYEDGTAPNYNATFKAGDVLVATYLDYTVQNETATAGDFYIKGAQIRLNNNNGQKNGLRYIVEMNDGFYNELTKYSESIIDAENPNYGTLILPTTLTKGRSMFYEKPIVVEWSLSDGKLGTKESPYDVDQAHNATPITTNSVFKQAHTPKNVPAVKTFNKTETATQFTVCLTGTAKRNYSEYYSVRGYIRYIDANGYERVFYSDYYQTSLYEMAQTAKANNEKGYYIDYILDYVDAAPGEGGFYDDYMAQNYANRTLLSGYPSTADTDPNHKMYQLANGLKVREVEINYSGNENDDAVEIVHFADTHLNWINEQDLYNAYPVTLSTYRGRSWNRNGSSTAAITTALEYGFFFDQVVITGDVMDYFSWGCAEIMEKLILGRSKSAILSMGNHEPAEKMQNDANVPNVYDGRTEIYPVLQSLWPNDIYYHSKIVYNDDNKAKAMVVSLNNEQDIYIAEQGTKLAADVAVAREMGIPILIFQHDPICTNNPEADPMWFFYEKGDWGWQEYNANNANHKNFPYETSGGKNYILATLYNPEVHDAKGLTPYTLNSYSTLWVNDPATNALVPPTYAWYSQRGAGRSGSDAVTKEVYNVIVSNADVIKGVFCGHVHNHMYTEIKATYVDENGQTVNTVIPQYCVTANAYSNGNAIKITVK